MMVTSRQTTFKLTVIFAFLIITLLPVTLSRSTTAQASQSAPQITNNTLLPDGSFEQDPSLWVERDNTGCTPWIGDWSSISGFPSAHDGSQYFWAGGACGPPNQAAPNTNNVRQTISIQPIDTTLSFWYYALRSDADSNSADDDYAFVQFNGEIVWDLDLIQANNTEGWVQATIDVSAYAGGTINLKVGVVNGNEPGVGNVFFDLFEINQGTVGTPEISISKGPDTQTIGVNETAEFSIVVTNEGNTTLYNVRVTDPKTPNCARTIGDMIAGASFQYECRQNGVTDSFINTANALGQTIDNDIYSDSDTAEVIVNDPGLTVDVSPASQTISENGTAVFTISVTNIGNVQLSNIVVSSLTVPDCDYSLATLPAQATHTFPDCSKTNVTQNFINTVNAAANAGGSPIIANATAFVDVLNSQIDITITPDQQTIIKGDTAQFNITVQNMGNDDLANIEITSSEDAACNRTFPTLLKSSQINYSCSISNVQAPFTQAVTVEATNPQQTVEIQDSDIGVVNMLDAILQTTASHTEIESPGGIVSFDMSLGNAGNIPLTLDGITAVINSNEVDPTPAPILNSSCTIGQALPVNSGSYNCSFDLQLFGPAGAYSIDIAIIASDSDGNELSRHTTSALAITTPTVQTVYLPTIFYNYIYSEPNNSCSDAFPISPDTTYRFLADDRDDWYKVDLITAANITLELTNFLPVDGQITAWSGPCNSLQFLGHNGDFSTTKILSLGDQPAGTYYIWIINDGAFNNQNHYNLRFSTVP